MLVGTGTDDATYFSGAQFVHVLPSPAIVALAVPIVRYRREIQRNSSRFRWPSRRAHGIGTARALKVHPVAGTFAVIAMAPNGLLTASLAPLVLALLS